MTNYSNALNKVGELTTEIAQAKSQKAQLEIDTTYADYGYRNDLYTPGVTSSMLAFVNFGHTEAISGNYSPVALTGTDYVRIYSKVFTEITVPSIIVFK